MKKYSVIISTLIFMLVLSTAVSAYDLPQKYSSDSYKTEIPEITIPDEPELQNGILTYVNNELLPLVTKAVSKGKTVFIPVEEFFTRLGFTVTGKNKIEITGENVTASVKTGSKKVTVNGKSVKLTKKIRKIKGIVMAPAGLAAEVLNAKVWFDGYSDTLAITTGKYKSDDILRAVNYKFWMNGEPYYELSFNKWDLLYQISAAYTNDSGWPADEDRIPAAEDALKLLQKLGLRTIRVFVHSGLRSGAFEEGEAKDRYYEVMDTMFNLCDQYGIQVVVCMMLPAGDFCTGGEDFFDLICDRNSASRQRMYGFIDEYVTRYKDRYSVLMWEIVNEGNLECDIGWQVGSDKYSLYQCGQFYADCAERIHMNDPERLVTGGDACLRPSQWHQYLGVKEGMIGSVNWTQDTLEDRLKAYVMLYSGLDVVSVHCYNTGYNLQQYRTSDTDDTLVDESFDLLMKEVRRIGKVLYNGETAVDADSYTYEKTYEPSVKFINDIIDSGVQLSHWWTFHTDNSYHRVKTGWDLTSGELLDAILDGNRRLKEKYIVNEIASENTQKAWADAPDTEINVSFDNFDIEYTPFGCSSSSGSVSFVLSAVFLFMFAASDKKRRKA